MTTNHTPTPWHARVEAGLDLVTAQRDHVCGGVNEESVFSLHRNPEERKANAAFIVRACNAHERLERERDELVAALRDIAADDYSGDSYQQKKAMISRALEALSKVAS